MTTESTEEEKALAEDITKPQDPGQEEVNEKTDESGVTEAPSTEQTDGLSETEEHPEAVKQIDLMEESLRKLRDSDPITYPIQVNEGESETNVEEVSTESFTQWMPGTEFMTSLSDYFTGFTDKINEAIAGAVKVKDELAKYIANIREGEVGKIAIYANRKQYFMISKTVKVYQPHQLNVSWVEYADWLRRNVEDLSSIDRQLLGPIAEYLGRSINKPDMLSSLTVKPQYQLKDIEKIKGEMKRIFSGPGVEKVYWGKAFQNNGQAQELVQLMNKVADAVELLKPDTVLKTSDLIVERANLISQGIKKADSKYILNKKQSQHISEVLFLCAQYVTMYSVLLTLVDEFISCIKLTATNLK